MLFGESETRALLGRRDHEVVEARLRVAAGPEADATRLLPGVVGQAQHLRVVERDRDDAPLHRRLAAAYRRVPSVSPLA